MIRSNAFGMFLVSLLFGTAAFAQSAKAANCEFWFSVRELGTKPDDRWVSQVLG